MLRGERTLVAAHGNSLRALIMVLEKLSPEQILKRELGDRRTNHLPPQRRLHRRLEARSGVVSGSVEISVLDAPLALDAAPSINSHRCSSIASRVAPASASWRRSHRPMGLRIFVKSLTRSRQATLCCFAAKLDGKIVGTVQLGLDTPPNQPHRADLKKMLVHRSARGRGIGAELLAQIEVEAIRRGRWLLVLDTVPGENGYRLYKRAGWTESGIIPNYALFPDGRLSRHRGVLEAVG